ncbi:MULTISPECIES: class I SAM-dependent methyltransferase [unclassified Sphingomonas]|uniref:class I SAM-dependent methyltransferase n=1 Tax=unclassified Sphingomonas TaxID=196159 RepID=UPI001D11CB95|nr:MULTISPECIES: class I SAM-dependent methyltransferase [unclassified Sphingomonas]MCC2981323.1 methyltransferase domain-containing protein [Sphingomonas sp. IC4-52]MCD2317035.1 methyltransferase domain-containing protein [Sphingomonas sp. IC-11]
MTALDVAWPDLETSSEAFASRFGDEAGAYFLDVQRRGVAGLLPTSGLSSILDLGGGHCQLAGQLVETGAAVMIFGSDRRCAERLARDPVTAKVQFQSGDLLATPYDDASFDLVTSIRLLGHVNYWHVLIAELCRLARRTVIIDYPSMFSPSALRLLSGGANRPTGGDPRTYRRYRPGQISACFARHGFRLAGEYRQLTLPFGMHRRYGPRASLVEERLRAWGVTAWMGNPVLARFDRIEG